MSAYNAIGAAVYSKLAGSATLTAMLHSGSLSLYNVEPPYEAAYDYVVFNVQGGNDTNDTRHRVKDISLQVRAYATNLAKAGTIDAACDALLHGGSLAITGWVTLWQVRAQDIELVEYDESNRPIYTRGGLYDLKIEKT